MDNRLNGLNPLAYTGVAPVSVAQLLYKRFDPTTTDSQNFSIGAVWINTVAETAWILMSLAGGVADWVKFASSGSVFILSVLTNSGSAVPNASGVLDILGTGVVTTSGSGNTVTIAVSGTVADSFPTDSGTAVPVAGVLNIFGTANQIVTSGSGNTVTAAFTPSIIVANNITSTVGNITAASGNIVANEIASDANGPIFALFKSRAGGVITSGDTLGNLQFYGFDGTGFDLSSAIKCTTVGTIGAVRIPSQLEFFTHPDSVAASPSQRVVITAPGTLTINGPDSGVAVAAGGQINVGGDSGAGTVSTTGITNVVNTTQGAGTLSIKSTTANPGNNTGFLKFYVGTTPVFVPYFVTINP